MSQRERALSALHRLRDFEHGRQEAAHRLAQRDERRQHDVVARVRSDLHDAQQQAGDSGEGIALDLGRAALVAQVLEGLHDRLAQQVHMHAQAQQRTAFAASAHLAAQRQRDQVDEHLALERRRLQRSRDVRDFDDNSDLLLARLRRGDSE